MFFVHNLFNAKSGDESARPLTVNIDLSIIIFSLAYKDSLESRYSLKIAFVSTLVTPLRSADWFPWISGYCSHRHTNYWPIMFVKLLPQLPFNIVSCIIVNTHIFSRFCRSSLWNRSQSPCYDGCLQSKLFLLTIMTQHSETRYFQTNEMT